jgi:translation initiation factor IF-3
LRVVFPDGQVEVLATPVALRRAQELQLDLVLVSPTADPPVAKVIDFGVYTYQQKKRQHQAKKKQHVMELKEVKFRPNTDDHDYGFKRNHAVRFLQEGNKVKATVAFRGREITHTDLGRSLLERLVTELAEHGAVEGRPRMEGRLMHVIISPKKTKGAVAQPSAAGGQ